MKIAQAIVGSFLFFDLLTVILAPIIKYFKKKSHKKEEKEGLLHDNEQVAKDSTAVNAIN
jgi:hypothetical protein